MLAIEGYCMESMDEANSERADAVLPTSVYTSRLSGSEI
jgi:hypothetical protein